MKGHPKFVALLKQVKETAPEPDDMKRAEELAEMFHHSFLQDGMIKETAINTARYNAEQRADPSKWVCLHAFTTLRKYHDEDASELVPLLESAFEPGVFGKSISCNRCCIVLDILVNSEHNVLRRVIDIPDPQSCVPPKPEILSRLTGLKMNVLKQGGPQVEAACASLMKICQPCGKYGLTLMKCTHCADTYYCGKECQKSDWNKHKKSE